MAALSPSKIYRLEVVGGNSFLHGAILQTDDSDELVIVNGSAEKKLKPALLQSTENPGILRARAKSEAHQSSPSVYTLQGPSGKGEYQLKVSDDPHPFGLGWRINFEEWKIMADGDRLLLRYEDTASCSHWIAVQDTAENGDERWVAWWISPNAANMEDFETYRLIDIEVVEHIEG